MINKKIKVEKKLGIKKLIDLRVDLEMSFAKRGFVLKIATFFQTKSCNADEDYDTIGYDLYFEDGVFVKEDIYVNEEIDFDVYEWNGENFFVFELIDFCKNNLVQFNYENKSLRIASTGEEIMFMDSILRFNNKLYKYSLKNILKIINENPERSHDIVKLNNLFFQKNRNGVLFLPWKAGEITESGDTGSDLKLNKKKFICKPLSSCKQLVDDEKTNVIISYDDYNQSS